MQAFIELAIMLGRQGVDGLAISVLHTADGMLLMYLNITASTTS